MASIIEPGGHTAGREKTRGGGGLPVPGLLRLDWILLVAVFGLMAGSIGAVDAATQGDLTTRQGVFFGIGLVGMLVLSQVDYSRLRELKWSLYGLMILLILAVVVFGGDTRGSRRALQTPFVELQTSEIGKVLLALVLAGVLVGGSRQLRQRDTTALAMLVALVPTALVLGTDLGSGMVYVVIALAALFMAGTKWTHFVALITLGVTAIALTVVVLPQAGVEVLKPYQVERLTSFLEPSADPGDAGYQQNQSVIATGSGGRLGRGEQATQTQLRFLPEAQTDFAYATVAERWGFVGAALVLSLYALLIWRGLRILTMAKNLYGSIIAGCVVAMLLFQVFINVGMNVGIMPITGIPLPLMSYGGSSVISTLLAIGLLQSIHVQARASRKGLL